jgi:hypothetical protein
MVVVRRLGRLHHQVGGALAKLGGDFVQLRITQEAGADVARDEDVRHARFAIVDERLDERPIARVVEHGARKIDGLTTRGERDEAFRRERLVRRAAEIKTKIDVAAGFVRMVALELTTSATYPRR